MTARKLLLSILLLLPAFFSYAQETEAEDSLVRLISADTLRQVERDGITYRRASGRATFLHNNTYLICDTALWNVQSRLIEAIGNVHIIQDRTELESERMIYRIDLDLAEFRGNVVQLRDKDFNTLRTSHLDYNTKDSVAVFREGGSMRDKDGQIIESETGTYDSKIKEFTFVRDVNMFTDSIFVKTTRLKYESDRNLATFGTGTNAWKDDNMLSAEAGWYDRGRELFFFRNKVHVMSQDQEAWSDSLYFYRNTMVVDMLGNAQVTDTTKNVIGVAGHINYVDSLSRVIMTRKPAVLARTDDNGQVDTVYFGADTLIYRTVKKCDIDSATVAAADARKKNIDFDPVSEFRKKAAKEAAQKAAEAAANDPNRPPDRPDSKAAGERPDGKAAAERPDGKAGAERPDGKAAAERPTGQAAAAMKSDGSKRADRAGRKGLDSLGVTVPDSLGMVTADSLGIPTIADSLGMTAAVDSLGMTPVADSLGMTTAPDSLGMAAIPTDSVTVVQPDTTKIGFVTALRNVKIFRENMQVICDSLEYSDLDSLARLFKNPVIWNEITQQFNADSVTAVIRNQAMEKVNLMSNSFIHLQQEENFYNQVRGAEMMAYFSSDNQLSRFDAMGGASAIFYLEENGVLATANKKDCKMLSAYFVDGNINRVYYFDTAVSDAYPVAQMTNDDRTLKGFTWTPELRPADRYAITAQELRQPERSEYSSVPRAQFVNTGVYFPGYIDGIYTQIAQRDSLQRVRERERLARERELERLESIRIKDSIDSVLTDSLKLSVLADSLAVALPDSLKTAADSLKTAADSLKTAADSLGTAAKDSTVSVTLTKKELREKAKAAKAAKKAEAQAAREAKWADKDKRDADKAAAKAQKKLDKERKRKYEFLMDEQKKLQKEQKQIERYKEKYAAKAAKKSAKAAKKAAKADKNNRVSPTAPRTLFGEQRENVQNNL